MVEVYFIGTVSKRSFYSVVLVIYKHLLRRAVKKKSEQLFNVFINTLLFCRLQQAAEISISELYWYLCLNTNKINKKKDSNLTEICNSVCGLTQSRVQRQIQKSRPCSRGLTPVTPRGYCLYPGTKIRLFTPMVSHLLSPPALITIPLI